MWSPNLLKSQIHYTVRGIQLPTFDTGSKSAKIPNLLYGGGGRGVQLQTLDAESTSSKIPNSSYGGGGGEL